MVVASTGFLPYGQQATSRLLFNHLVGEPDQRGAFAVFGRQFDNGVAIAVYGRRYPPTDAGPVVIAREAVHASWTAGVPAHPKRVPCRGSSPSSRVLPGTSGDRKCEPASGVEVGREIGLAGKLIRIAVCILEKFFYTAPPCRRCPHASLSNLEALQRARAMVSVTVTDKPGPTRRSLAGEPNLLSKVSRSA